MTIPSSPPKAIFFDVAGVLASDPMDPWYASVLKSHGVERLDAYGRVKDLFDAFEEGRLDEQGYWSGVGRRFDAPASRVEAWRLMAYAELKLLSGVKDLLFELKQRNVTMGIISNTSKEWSSHLLSRVLPSAWFDHVILSCEVGQKKPHASIFEAAAHAVGNPSASELLFLDNSKKNIDAAKALGWDVALVESADQIRAALKARGL